MREERVFVHSQWMSTEEFPDQASSQDSNDFVVVNGKALKMIVCQYFYCLDVQDANQTCWILCMCSPYILNDTTFQ